MQLTSPVGYKFLDVNIWVGGRRTGGISGFNLLKRQPWEERVRQQRMKERGAGVLAADEDEDEDEDEEEDEEL